MKKALLVFAIAGSALFISSCNRSGNQDAETNLDTAGTNADTLSGETKEKVDFKFFYTIANLPSPMELINDIYQNEVPFNSDLLNPTDNEPKYTSAFKKSANYGIYGIDMAYAAFYGQNQDLINCYLTAKKMSERLDISETFEQYTSDFERNQGNRDSLVRIVDRAYTETDNYLRSNNRYMTASQVLAGAIIEVQYLSIELMKTQERNAKNDAIFQKIFNQKLYLDNLIGLFEELKSDADCNKLLVALKDQKKAFDELKSPDELNQATMAKLGEAVSKTRTMIIK